MTRRLDECHAARGCGGRHGHALDNPLGREAHVERPREQGIVIPAVAAAQVTCSSALRPWSPARSPGWRGPRPSPGRAMMRCEVRRAGTEVRREDQQFEPDEPARLDGIHRLAVLRVEISAGMNTSVSVTWLLSGGGESGGLPERRPLDAYESAGISTTASRSVPVAGSATATLASSGSSTR